MRHPIIRFLISSMLLIGTALHGFPTDRTLNTPHDKKIILNGTGIKPRLADEMPSAWYSETTQTLSISFPVEGFEPYTLTVESMYASQDYYVTTPQVSVPVYVTGLTIDLQLETDSGDVYWGTFDATSTTSTD